MPGMEKTMHEFKKGTLKSGSGKKVTKKSQAVAIGMSSEKPMMMDKKSMMKPKMKPKMKSKHDKTWNTYKKSRGMK